MDFLDNGGLKRLKLARGWRGWVILSCRQVGTSVPIVPRPRSPFISLTTKDESCEKFSCEPFLYLSVISRVMRWILLLYVARRPRIVVHSPVNPSAHLGRMGPLINYSPLRGDDWKQSVFPMPGNRPGNSFTLGRATNWNSHRSRPQRAYASLSCSRDGADRLATNNRWPLLLTLRREMHARVSDPPTSNQRRTWWKILRGQRFFFFSFQNKFSKIRIEFCSTHRRKRKRK